MRFGGGAPHEPLSEKVFISENPVTASPNINHVRWSYGPTGLPVQLICRLIVPLLTEVGGPGVQSARSTRSLTARASISSNTSMP